MLKCLSARLYSKQKTKSSKNYYDILKLTPYATQNEVKSAYYKLTLQYHPDKNESEYAKQKFQDISEAYEVLSNHELRKNYDRRMMIYQQPMSATSKESMSQYKDKVYSGTSRIYNFDAWVHAHYGKQMHADRIRRYKYDKHIEMEKLYNNEKQPKYIEISLLLLTITIIAILYQKNVDIPKSKNKTENKKNSD
jgi:DnaJ-class molecular chaperone